MTKLTVKGQKPICIFTGNHREMCLRADGSMLYSSPNIRHDWIVYWTRPEASIKRNFQLCLDQAKWIAAHTLFNIHADIESCVYSGLMLVSHEDGSTERYIVEDQKIVRNA